MAEEPAALADRLFTSVLAPLVLGGTLQPAHPIGARSALALLSAAPQPSDSDLASRVDLLRVAQARRLAPIDTVEEPSGAEWALGAVFHDLLQATSPSWIRKSAPKRLLDLAGATLERIPPVGSAREALSRHTWLARLFDVRRQDTAVSWWTGSREFRGKEPPKRLFLWPELRRVNVERAERGLTELLEHGGRAGARARVRRRARPRPARHAAHRLRRLRPRRPAVRMDAGDARDGEGAGRAHARPARASRSRPVDDADAALGRATRALFAAKEWKDASTALDFLGHRAMSAAQGPSAIAAPGGGRRDDAVFARTAGAMVARRWLDEPSRGLPDAERRRLAPIFDAARAGRARARAASSNAPRSGRRRRGA